MTVSERSQCRDKQLELKSSFHQLSIRELLHNDKDMENVSADTRIPG